MSLPSDHPACMERALLSLEGLAIGDALGEMLSCDCEGARERVERGLSAGPWVHTDDTEMALSIVEVLRSRGRIEPDLLALDFAERFRKDPDRGYGSMSRRTLQQILSGRPWKEAAESAFSGMGSMGNGSAMRVAPLGAYFAGNPALRGEAVLSSIVTHTHREAQAGAIAVATAAALAWQWRSAPKERASAELLQGVYEATPESETHVGLARALKLPFFTAARVAGRHLGNGSAITAPDTVPFAVWSAAKHLDNFKEAMIETALADGDCDTNCAIVGGIVVLYAGRESIPEDWQAARERFDFEQQPADRS